MILDVFAYVFMNEFLGYLGIVVNRKKKGGSIMVFID